MQLSTQICEFSMNVMYEDVASAKLHIVCEYE